MSVEATLSDQGPKAFISIELPCFVKRKETAMKMIGGEEQVCKSLTLDDAPALQCRLPGTNMLRSNLVASTIDRSGLVVKIRRKKKIVDGVVVTSVTAVEIVGVIKKTIAFNNPADYQFLPANLDVNTYKPSSAPSRVHFPLEIAPQSLSRIDFEKRAHFLNFLYVSKRAKRAGGAPKKSTTTEDTNEDGNVESGDEDRRDESNARESTMKQRNPDAGYTQIIKFGDQVPYEHPLGKYPPRWLAKKEKTGEVFRGLQFIDKLVEIFAKVPVMKRQQLVDILDLGPRQHLFKECLPYAAFTYSNGPYANLWVRHGYDPTADPTARIYQQLNCRFPPQYLKDLSDRLAEHIGRDSVHRKMVELDTMTVVEAPEEFSHRFIDKGAFARLPLSLYGYVCKMQIAFQVHTLSEHSTFQFVNKLNVANVCAEQTGWYTEDAVVKFRTYIVDLLGAKTQAFLEQQHIVFQAAAPSQPLKPEDPAVDLRLKQFIAQFDVLQSSENLQCDSYPETDWLPKTPVTNMLFWLHKYHAAAMQKVDLVDRILLPKKTIATMEWSSQPVATTVTTSTAGSNNVMTPVSSSAVAKKTSSSSKSTSKRTTSTISSAISSHAEEERLADQTAMLASALAQLPHGGVSTSGTGNSIRTITTPAVGTSLSTSSSAAATAAAASGTKSVTKRTVKFAPNLSAAAGKSTSSRSQISSSAASPSTSGTMNSPSGNASSQISSVIQPQTLQFSLDSGSNPTVAATKVKELVMASQGFGMLDDSDSEED